MSTDSLGDFLAEIGRYPLLTPAEELHLSTMVREWLDYPGGPDQAPRPVQRRGQRAKKRMMEANIRLCVHVARKYSQRATVGFSFQDQIQEATLGLDRAVEKFDPTRGYKFSTYAYWWIRQAIGRGMQQYSSTVRVPIHAQETLTKIKMATAELSQTLGRMPTRAELAQHLDKPEVAIENALAALRVSRPTALDASRDSGGEGVDLHQILADDRNPDMLDAVAMDVRSAQVELAMEVLAPLEKAAVLGCDAEGRTLSSVAREQGVSREAVRKAQGRARMKLRVRASRLPALAA